jgi:hypothetical protein
MVPPTGLARSGVLPSCYRESAGVIVASIARDSASSSALISSLAWAARKEASTSSHRSRSRLRWRRSLLTRTGPPFREFLLVEDISRIIAHPLFVSLPCLLELTRPKPGSSFDPD